MAVLRRQRKKALTNIPLKGGIVFGVLDVSEWRIDYICFTFLTIYETNDAVHFITSVQLNMRFFRFKNYDIRVQQAKGMICI